MTFPGPAGSGWAELFNDGFKWAIDGVDNITLLDEKLGDSGVSVQLQLIRDALQAYPEMNVIWGSAPTARDAIADLGFALEPGQKVVELSRAHQQMTEIAKALMGSVRVLILDEPKASLTESETVLACFFQDEKVDEAA